MRELVQWPEKCCRSCAGVHWSYEYILYNVKWSTESSSCTQLLKKVGVVGVNLSCSGSSHQAEHQSLSQWTGRQTSGGASWLVGREKRLIKNDPLVQGSLITFSPAVHQTSLWRGGSNLRPKTWSWSTWVTLLMSERSGGSSHCWAGKKWQRWEYFEYFYVATVKASQPTWYLSIFIRTFRYWLILLGNHIRNWPPAYFDNLTQIQTCFLFQKQVWKMSHDQKLIYVHKCVFSEQ